MLLSYLFTVVYKPVLLEALLCLNALIIFAWGKGGAQILFSNYSLPAVLTVLSSCYGAVIASKIETGQGLGAWVGERPLNYWPMPLSLLELLTYLSCVPIFCM